jgi:pimeloyl-ACP methyl ester carboxylesterase
VFARTIAAATAAAVRARGLTRHRVEIGPWQLRVWRGGKPGGEPWLLLHGMGATSATFLPLLGALRGECEIVLPELSANGGTRGPRAAIGVADGAAVVAELAAREFGGRRPTLCGVSLGAWIAAKVAIARPEQVARLVLVSPGGYKNQDWRRIESIVHVETLADIKRMWQALFVAPPWYLRPARYLLYFLYTTPTVRDVLATVREEDAFDDADLARLTLPVGLIFGEGDTLFRPEVGEAMRRALPNARLTVVPRAAHGLQWEKPREFFEAVERFRAEFPLRGAAAGAQDAAANRDRALGDR